MVGKKYFRRWWLLQTDAARPDQMGYLLLRWLHFLRWVFFTCSMQSKTEEYTAKRQKLNIYHSARKKY